MNKDLTASEGRRRRAAWVALRIMPHEAQSRGWLRRARVADDEADDLVQEAYCRLAALDEVEHIEQPGAYFFSIIRNLLLRRRRAETVVSLENIVEIESMPAPGLGIEAEVTMRLDVERLIGALPGPCRRVIEMRKIEGYSQREIAQLLGITESVVENHVQRGLKAMSRGWQGEGEKELRAPIRLDGKRKGRP